MPGLQRRVRVRGVRLVAAGLLAAFFCGVPLPAAGADPYRDVSLALGEGLLALFHPDAVIRNQIGTFEGHEAISGFYRDVAFAGKARPRVVRCHEEGRVAIRNVRRDVMQDLKELVRDGEVGDDEERRAEERAQKMTDEHVHRIDELLKKKEEEIMEV